MSSYPGADRILAGRPSTHAKPFRRPKGRVAYPRRITLDLDDERYEWLKEQVWEHRIEGGMAALLRSLIDDASRHNGTVEPHHQRGPGARTQRVQTQLRKYTS